MICYCDGANKGTWNNDDCLEVFLFEVKQQSEKEEKKKKRKHTQFADNETMYVISIINFVCQWKMGCLHTPNKTTEKKRTEIYILITAYVGD